MCLLLAFAYRRIAWHTSPLIPFSTIYNESISVKRSKGNLVFFKAACHANPGTVKKRAMSVSCVSRHVFRKFSNTSANNNV